METYYLVLRGDLNVASKHATETEAREHAQKLCEKTGKDHLVAQVIARVQVDRFPIKWQEIGDSE